MFQTHTLLNFTVLANPLPLTVFNLPTKSVMVVLTPTYSTSLDPKHGAEAAGFVPFSAAFLGKRVTRIGAGSAVLNIQLTPTLEMWKEHLGFITQHGCGGIVWLGIPATSATGPGFLPGCSGLSFFPLCCLVSWNKGYSAHRKENRSIICKGNTSTS